ncbi:MAG: SDR family oxidoreductase [Bacteroidota bacterium]
MVKMDRGRPIALILGGSSGLGAATAKKLAREAYDIVVVHRDRRADMEKINALFHTIEDMGAKCHGFNADAVHPVKRLELWRNIKEVLKGQKIKVVVHSIAKGNLKPMIGPGETLNNQDFQITLQAMAVSLFDWVKQIADDNCFDEDARVIAFTSEGSTKAIPDYAAVSASKAALESIIRNIALEFAPLGIRANCIQAGVTETKALKLIPKHGALIKNAIHRNPHNRLTIPEDVANAVYLLTLPEAAWITGTVIKVDGGESLQ